MILESTPEKVQATVNNAQSIVTTLTMMARDLVSLARGKASRRQPWVQPLACGKGGNYEGVLGTTSQQAVSSEGTRLDKYSTAPGASEKWGASFRVPAKWIAGQDLKLEYWIRGTAAVTGDAELYVEWNLFRPGDASAAAANNNQFTVALTADTNLPVQLSHTNVNTIPAANVLAGDLVVVRISRTPLVSDTYAEPIELLDVHAEGEVSFD